MVNQVMSYNYKNAVIFNIVTMSFGANCLVYLLHINLALLGLIFFHFDAPIRFLYRILLMIFMENVQCI